jgi:hypothetical protein
MRIVRDADCRKNLLLCLVAFCGSGTHDEMIESAKREGAQELAEKVLLSLGKTTT